MASPTQNIYCNIKSQPSPPAPKNVLLKIDTAFSDREAILLSCPKYFLSVREKSKNDNAKHHKMMKLMHLYCNKLPIRWRWLVSTRNPKMAKILQGNYENTSKYW